MESCSAMEAAATMEAITAVEPSATMKALSVEAAVKPATAKTAAVVAAAPIVAATIVTSTVEAAAVVRTAIVAVKPGAGTDKDAIHEPVWAVVAVRRASIRIVVVITVGADGSRPIIWASYSDADEHALGIGVRR